MLTVVGDIRQTTGHRICFQHSLGLASNSP